MYKTGLLIFFALTSWCHPAFAEWQVTTITDAMTDKQNTVAITKNPDGFTLMVFRLDNGEAEALFTVPNTAPPLDPDNDKVGLLRIDKLKANDLAVQKTFDDLLKDKPDYTPRLHISAHSIAFHLDGYDHRDKSPTLGELRDMMDGEKLLFRYFTLTGTFEDVEFDLHGAKAAIAKVLAFAEEPDPDEMARRSIWVAASNKCAAEKPDCATLVAKCGEQSMSHDCLVAASNKCTAEPPCRAFLNKCDRIPDHSSKALSDCLDGSPK
jgi:hypothetical protein